MNGFRKTLLGLAVLLLCLLGASAAAEAKLSFTPKNLDLKKGDHVIVETAVGVEYGEVAVEKKQVTDDQVKKPVKDIMRKANEKDDQKYEQNKEKEKKAFKTCKEKIAKHGLEMKLIKVEYTFDGKKIMFYFTADGRVDFRELVKDLASVFRTRIELRQVDSNWRK